MCMLIKLIDLKSTFVAKDVHKMLLSTTLNVLCVCHSCVDLIQYFKHGNIFRLGVPFVTIAIAQSSCSIVNR